jgi:tetratricopeptide (TPR) repeat protein
VNASDDVTNDLRRQAEAGDPQASKLYADAVFCENPADAGFYYVRAIPFLGECDYRKVEIVAQSCYDDRKFEEAARLFSFLNHKKKLSFPNKEKYAHLLAYGLGTDIDVAKAIDVLFWALEDVKRHPEYASDADRIKCTRSQYDEDGSLWERTGEASPDDRVKHRCFVHAITPYIRTGQLQKAERLHRRVIEIAEDSYERIIDIYLLASFLDKCGDRHKEAASLFAQVVASEYASVTIQDSALRHLEKMPESVLIDALEDKGLFDRFTQRIVTCGALCRRLRILDKFIRVKGDIYDAVTSFNADVESLQDAVSRCERLELLKSSCSLLVQIKRLIVCYGLGDVTALPPSQTQERITNMYERGLNNVLVLMRRTRDEKDYCKNCLLLLGITPFMADKFKEPTPTATDTAAAIREEVRLLQADIRS